MVLVATPSPGGSVSYIYLHSLLKLLTPSATRAFDVAVLTTSDEAWATGGRNAFVSQFLGVQAATHLLLVEPEVAFDLDAVDRLLRLDTEVCGAGHPTSLLMVKRGVLERMTRGAARVSLFDGARDEAGEWLSGAAAFCQRFRRMGGSVCVDVETTAVGRPQSSVWSAEALSIPPRVELRQSPILTRRLVLSPLEPADADELWSTVNGSRPELAAWLPTMRFHTDARASKRYATMSALEWDGETACRFSVRDRATGALHGVVGLEGISKLRKSGDLGYWLATGSTGRGFATEAGRAVVSWAFAHLGAYRVQATAATENFASIRVLERIGLRREGTARGMEACQGERLDHEVFGLLRTDDTLDARERDAASAA
jgi:RimJ/RimL family protein N-acetyltransferase